MRYIAIKKEDKFEVTGIKTMKDLKGKDVEVKFATKDYDKKQLADILLAYEIERNEVAEKYANEMKDMESILKAIKEAE